MLCALALSANAQRDTSKITTEDLSPYIFIPPAEREKYEIDTTRIHPLDAFPDIRYMPPYPDLSTQDFINPNYRTKAEVPPTIIGGMEELQRVIRYPQLARRAGVEGIVTVRVYLDSTAKVRHARVERGIGGGCDEEAVEAVKKVKFTPAMDKGQPVHVRIFIPVEFRLSKEEKRKKSTEEL